MLSDKSIISSNGTSSDIVGMGIPLSLTPMQYQPKNTIKATPVITSPGMISTTNSGIVSSFPRFGFM